MKKENLDFGVVYRNSEKMEVLPYYDYERQNEIIGVEVDGVKIALYQQKCSWAKALSLAERAKGSLFTVNELQRLYAQKGRVNRVISFLRKKGLPADFLNGRYWSVADCLGTRFAQTVEMTAGTASFADKHLKMNFLVHL